MNRTEFRQQLIIAAIQGLTSNAFLAEQLALRNDAAESVSRMAVKIADETEALENSEP